MPMQARAAILSAAFFVGVAASAHAQGSITQDPGSHAPRNLTLQYLGPSDASVAIPGERGPNGWQPLAGQLGRGATATPPAYGSSLPSARSGESRMNPLGGSR